MKYIITHFYINLSYSNIKIWRLHCISLKTIFVCNRFIFIEKFWMHNEILKRNYTEFNSGSVMLSW